MSKITLYKLRRTIFSCMRFGQATIDIDENAVLIISGYNNILKFGITKRIPDITPKVDRYSILFNIVTFEYQEFDIDNENKINQFKTLILQALFSIVAYTDIDMYRGKF